MLLATAQGDNHIHELLHKVLISVDAILWFPMRQIMHDAVFFDIPNTWSSTEVGGLRGSRV